VFHLELGSASQWGSELALQSRLGSKWVFHLASAFQWAWVFHSALKSASQWPSELTLQSQLASKLQSGSGWAWM
jgi:hypothetical protein